MAERRIKILQIIGNTRLGGVASCLLNYIKYRGTDKYRFDFVTYAPTAFDDKIKQIDGEAKIYYIPRLDKNPLKAAKELKEICLKEDYAAVHSHMTILSAVALEPAAAAKIPVRICHAHSTFNKNADRYIIKKLMRPFACRYATHLAACSHTAAENIFKERANEAFILPNAIDGEMFYCTPEEHTEAKKQCGLEKNTALFTGRFAKQKNLGFLLEAFAKASRDDLELVLLGESEEEQQLKKQCKELGIDGKVRFVKPCNPAVWYKAADVFCLPSLYEGLSLSAIEAQAAGLSCLFSQAISKETDITGNCRFLEQDTDIWAKELCLNYERNYTAKDSIIAAGYDIKKETHRLTDYYDSIIGREN